LQATPTGDFAVPPTRAKRAPRTRVQTSYSPSLPDEIPRRTLGRTGEYVSAIGLGGYHLGTVSTEREATQIIHEAIDAGLTFMDNAWEYHDGKSEERMGKALVGRRDRVFLMSKVCTHGRDAKVAMRQLDESLRRLKTDYLDLWQVHELAFYNDPERHFAKGGVIDALDRAKAQGKVRFVGFTGHKDPAIHLKMLSYDYPFDTVQMPLNCFDATFRSFEQQVLPELERRGIAPIGMKSLGGEGTMVKKKAVTAQEALAYAMSLPVATTISGIDSLRVLRQNLKVARGFTPMSSKAMQTLRARCAELAADGRFELYKTTLKHEGPVARKQHGFPPPDDQES
jgi:aryl-alcohol dehydrogenase-like predicted oxidoreductase